MEIGTGLFTQVSDNEGLARPALWAVEIKCSLSPCIERGFHAACADINPVHRFVVYAGDDTYSAVADTQVVSLPVLAYLLAGVETGNWTVWDRHRTRRVLSGRLAILH